MCALFYIYIFYVYISAKMITKNKINIQRSMPFLYISNSQLETVFRGKGGTFYKSTSIKNCVKLFGKLH